MSKGLEALERFKQPQMMCDIDWNKRVSIIEKELKALEIIVTLFDIKVLGDYLMAQKGNTCIVENLKLRQQQEIINLLKEVLL